MNEGFIQALVGETKRDDGPTHKRPNIGEKVGADPDEVEFSCIGRELSVNICV